MSQFVPDLPLKGKGPVVPDSPSKRSTVPPKVPAKDPWEGRSKHMRCATCMHFCPKGDSPVGRCRRHAPTMSGFPVVFPVDWCGDHKLDENRVSVPPEV